MIDGLGISCEIALIRMSLDLTDKWKLVQVIAWSCQATSHYLSQFSPRFMSPYAVSYNYDYISCLFNKMCFAKSIKNCVQGLLIFLILVIHFFFTFRYWFIMDSANQSIYFLFHTNPSTNLLLISHPDHVSVRFMSTILIGNLLEIRIYH